MRAWPGEGVAAPTDRASSLGWLAATLLLAATCAGARTHAEEKKNAWKFEQAASRFTYYTQDGSGFQSQAGPGPRGAETLDVWNPAGLFRARQNEKVEHSLLVPIDIITSASINSVDATTSASRVNETITLDFKTRISTSKDDVVGARYGFHLEEWYRSIFGGIAYQRDLAQDNATVALSANGFFDVFRPYGPYGGLWPPGNNADIRGALNMNAEVSQILSPTTLVKGSYGFTWQAGELITPWNSVPVNCDPQLTVCPPRNRVQEKFPRSRLRHAISGLLAQHIPATSTTLRLRYRFYADDFDVRAHTLRAQVYQYATPRAYIRASYRVHRQNAVFFWTPSITLPGFSADAPRTADSDLAELWAHEVGGKAFIYIDPPGQFQTQSLDLGYNYYWRTNDLRVHVFSFGYNRVF